MKHTQPLNIRYAHFLPYATMCYFFLGGGRGKGGGGDLKISVNISVLGSVGSRTIGYLELASNVFRNQL